MEAARPQSALRSGRAGYPKGLDPQSWMGDVSGFGNHSGGIILLGRIRAWVILLR